MGVLISCLVLTIHPPSTTLEDLFIGEGMPHQSYSVRTFTCPADAPACLNGACISMTATTTDNRRCFDTDAGKNVGDRGAVSLYDGERRLSNTTDSCTTDHSVLENYCGPHSPRPLPQSETIECPAEIPICHNGRCTTPAGLARDLEDEADF